MYSMSSKQLIILLILFHYLIDSLFVTLGQDSIHFINSCTISYFCQKLAKITSNEGNYKYSGNHTQPNLS